MFHHQLRHSTSKSRPTVQDKGPDMLQNVAFLGGGSVSIYCGVYVGDYKLIRLLKWTLTNGYIQMRNVVVSTAFMYLPHTSYFEISSPLQVLQELHFTWWSVVSDNVVAVRPALLLTHGLATSLLVRLWDVQPVVVCCDWWYRQLGVHFPFVVESVCFILRLGPCIILAL